MNARAGTQLLQALDPRSQGVLEYRQNKAFKSGRWRAKMKRHRGPLEVPLQTLPVTVDRRTELVEAPAPTLSPTHDPSRSAALPRAAAASPHTTFAKGVCSQLQTVRAPDSSRHPPATTLLPTLLSSFACSSLGRRSLTNLLNHDHTMHVKTRHK